MAERKCGTCHYWRYEEVDNMRLCEWPHPPLPFWASISEGNDHADWTKERDGRSCKTWTEREE